MSDPKRATLITVGAPKSAKKNVNKTVRLTINLVESNESKYPELNYKELVIAEERKKKVENGKTPGLDPFSDNDDDVARVARKFEQKYGGKSTYGRTGRSKHDDFADIGAGYDENDSFIDNTHGYDEMIPPECDTLYGGFYINCGSLEFKTVENQVANHSDGEPGNRRNKRRMISSSSSEQDSSESSSESSQDVKDKPVANGEVSSHNTEHRKKKNKNIDKKKAKKVRRTDSSAANSGKQTSDDNAHGDGESADSRTSQSDSLTSKPAPSSENAATSDSSRDAEKVEVKLPPSVVQVLEDLEAVVNRNFVETPNLAAKELEAKTDQYLIRLERVLSKNGVDPASTKAAWTRAARCLGSTRSKLHQRVKSRPENHVTTEPPPPAPAAAQSAASKRKADDDDDEDFSRLTAAEREAKIVETLQRLKLLIEERKPDMISNYNAECARVQEEKKKLQVASAVEGAPVVEKRLPKRRFPWCPRSRALLVRLKRLAGSHEAAATLLAKRALPLFPNGFVRMPTLLRQADLSKDIKASDVKRQRLGSASQPAPPAPPAFVEPIHFPSSLTVTTTTNPPAPAAPAKEEDKYKPNSVLGTFFNLNKDLIVERPEDRKNDRVKDDVYVPPNNIGSITITPVIPAQKDKKPVVPDKPKEGLIRVKSPAALNEMVKKEKAKKPEKTNHVKEKRMDTPLHIDTNLQPSKKDPSPKKDEISPKQIETMRITENNIPRPALVPVRHSPTFAKPDKRPPEVKKKKDVVIVSDVDPLGDVQAEPFAVDDSSSDVELVEDSKNTDKSEPKIGDNKSDTVPSKDKVSDSKKVNSVKHKERSSKETKEKRSDSLDETTKEIDNVMREIREMQNSQEPTKLNSNSYAGVITSERTSLNKMDGCSAITG
ncbi:yemanuclein isoform X3 [Ostrinia furnacalis]|uniref:yemanuclein isoform X3 n=1 Tax=Ostrinia furnacalis TaxID=93504 RepID=UPI00103D8DF8|nr:yemanuclein isoform X3 [Ostrinia furnacalis]